MRLSHRWCIPALVALGLSLNACAAAETYTIDPEHSSVGFTVRHFVGKVAGKFNTFTGAITLDRDTPGQNTAEATIQTASIDTNSPKRDTHLRSADFLDATRFPEIRFKSKSWHKTGEHAFDVVGELTMKDVTKEIVLKVSLRELHPGAGGAQLSAEATARIDKKEFNVKDPPMLDATIGDDVNVVIKVEARKN